MNTKDILDRLIAFDTVSQNSNMALMHYIEQLLSEADIKTTLIPNAQGTKANLLATIGPTDSGGVMLSGRRCRGAWCCRAIPMWCLSKVKSGASQHLNSPVRTVNISVVAQQI